MTQKAVRELGYIRNLSPGCSRPARGTNESGAGLGKREEGPQLKLGEAQVRCFNTKHTTQPELCTSKE